MRTGLGRARDAERLVPRSAARFPPRFFLVLRIAVRVVEARTAWQVGVGDPWLATLAAAGCASLDLRIVALPRPGGRRRPVAQLLLDASDVAAWSLALGGASDIAAVIAVPTAGMWGLRYGWRGLAVPAVVGSAAMLALHLAGHPATPLVYLWPSLGVYVGVLAAGHLRERWRQENALAGQDIEAAAGQAELSGQNSVAMGADSVVDLLTRTGPLLAAYEPAAAPSPFAGWKAALAEQCGRRSAYLGVSLLRWQNAYNRRSPDLSADVRLLPRPGAGTLLLSQAQEVALFIALERLAPRGAVAVDVPSLGPVGQEQTVLVGAERIVLAADRLPQRCLLQPAPVLFAWGATLVLSHSLFDGVPYAVTAPMAAVVLGWAWLFHRFLPLEGPGRCRLMLAVALALGTADALVSTVMAHTSLFDHSQRLPFVLFLNWYAPLAVFYGRELTFRFRAVIVTGVAAVLVIGAVLEPGHFGVPDLLLSLMWSLVWPLAAALAILGLRELLDLDGADLHEQLAARRNDAVTEAFRSGRRLVIDLTADAVAELRRRYEAARDGLPGEVAAELERRLSQAQTRLAALDETG